MTKTILIVDDDDTLRHTLANGLRNSGYNVLTAQNADIAEQILARIAADAMVLDRMMVGMDGLTFLKKLRTAGNKIPTILLTAMGGAENAIAGLSGGADDYLSKPFQLRELILRIENITKYTPQITPDTPSGLHIVDQEFFIRTQNGASEILSLSGEEKKMLYNLINPMGNIVSASPMVAKRLRNKLNSVLLNIDIVTIRGRGYKLICQNSDQDTGLPE